MKFLRLLILLLPLSVCGADRITISLKFTNAPPAGDTITVNGNVRTWRASPTVPSTEITTGANAGAAATNWYNHVIANPYAGPIICTITNGTNVLLLGATSQSMTYSGTYALVTYTTQAVAIAYTLRVPGSAEAPGVRAYNFSQAVTAIDAYSTNSFSQTTTALLNHVNLSNVQTVGNKTFTNSTVNGGYITNGTQIAMAQIRYATNGTNGGIVFYNNGDQIRYTIAAGAGGQPAIFSNLDLTIAANYNPLPESILNYNIATNKFGALAKDNAWTATNTFTRITNSTFVNGVITNTTFSGTIAALSGGIISATALTGPTATNLTTWGTNTLNGVATFPRINYTSLANGNNAGVDFGDYVFVKIKPGPTAAFTINGIAKGRDGRRLLLYNNTTNNCTIANDSGTDPAPSNRILTLTGADVVSTGDSFFSLIYDSDVSRWILTGSNL